MTEEIRENTNALHSLQTCIAVQTTTMQHQTEAIKELKDELQENGLATAIVTRVTRTFYKTTSLFGFIVTVIATALYFVLK